MIVCAAGSKDEKGVVAHLDEVPAVVGPHACGVIHNQHGCVIAQDNVQVLDVPLRAVALQGHQPPKRLTCMRAQGSQKLEPLHAQLPHSHGHALPS